ncbi:MAG TPA: hypothetical protein VIM12_16045 [Noviherbaspirillum sp.]|uniref:hypothetical protein n=1 Tax=Noviherbaspirillum sp. TaxID=1926288 RepID=UPI002F9326F7
MKKSAIIAVALASATILPAAAQAELSVAKPGVALVPPAANMGAVAPSEQASTARDPRKASGQTLRCWQNGRLLYEGSGFRSDQDRGPNAVAVQRNDGDSVVVFDQKDSICILSKK